MIKIYKMSIGPNKKLVKKMCLEQDKGRHLFS